MPLTRTLIRLISALALGCALLLLVPLVLGKVLAAFVPGEQIAYMSDGDGDWEIMLHDFERGLSVALTNNDAQDRYPSWSPDGSKLVYHSNEANGHYKLMILDMETGTRRMVGASHRQPFSDDAMGMWSPDGRYLAFHSNRDNWWNLYLLDVASERLYQVTYHWGDDVRIAWSPDGEQVTFASARADGFMDIYVMTLDDLLNMGRPADQPQGSGPDPFYQQWLPGTRLTTDSADDWLPSWSPDGEHLVFVSTRGGSRDIYLMDADGGNLRPLTQTGMANEHQPTFIPDGRVLFAGNYDCVGFDCYNFELYLVDPETGAREQITHTSFANEQAPAWRPRP